jgi:hypothetical protein
MTHVLNTPKSSTIKHEISPFSAICLTSYNISYVNYAIREPCP